MSYVSELVALYEIKPFIILALDNDTIRVAVKDYLEGGEKKDAVIKKYGPIEKWDTSKVTDMSELFKDQTEFNEDISKWNTSNVTNMNGMFYNAESFNQPIGEWNTSNVTYISRMFFGAKKFNQPIGKWNVSNVNTFIAPQDIFHAAIKFDLENAPWCRKNGWCNTESSFSKPSRHFRRDIHGLF
ncbi:hypothetical protein JO84_gp263 [Aureococcus anophagefferens virus]|uniref:Uncharacterized protein n=1 Tax=Aureococcus anophagefferens virus TaxID=1474867 RepID=A0A076FM27_9VIRU|nr:hypothetical protein JO84_gp263 [Aureococcus anophagefferens virus]AII16923.1 hypothetical protein AaV_212 [Aureococcus anophagefferens virus]UOG94126.1 hypothetical protein MKD35_85 [Aureococcus anophagefferens virus]